MNDQAQINLNAFLTIVGLNPTQTNVAQLNTNQTDPGICAVPESASNEQNIVHIPSDPVQITENDPEVPVLDQSCENSNNPAFEANEQAQSAHNEHMDQSESTAYQIDSGNDQAHSDSQLSHESTQVRQTVQQRATAMLQKYNLLHKQKQTKIRAKKRKFDKIKFKNTKKKKKSQYNPNETPACTSRTVRAIVSKRRVKKSKKPARLLLDTESQRIANDPLSKRPYSDEQRKHYIKDYYKKKRFYRILSEKEKEIYDEVALLAPLPDELFEPDKERTKQLIRRCYTEVLNQRMSYKTWEEEDIFSKYYLKRSRSNKRGKKIFKARAEPEVLQGETTQEAIVYRIWCHTTKIVEEKEKLDYLLIQWMCDPDPGLLPDGVHPKEYQDYGEISWQPVDNIEPTHDRLRDYLQHGKSDQSYHVYTDKDFAAKRTKGRKVGKLLLPDFSKPLASKFGKNSRELNQMINNWDPILLNKNNLSFSNVVSQISFYNQLQIKLNANNEKSPVLVFSNIVGKIHVNTKTHDKLNYELRGRGIKQVISTSTAASKIQRILGSESLANKKLIIILFFGFNTIASTKEPNNHCSVGILDRDKSNYLQYYFWEPTMEASSYWEIAKPMRELHSELTGQVKQSDEILRAYGNQKNKGSDCFIRSAKYATILKAKFNFKKNQAFKPDSEEKLNKKK